MCQSDPDYSFDFGNNSEVSQVPPFSTDSVLTFSHLTLYRSHPSFPLQAILSSSFTSLVTLVFPSPSVQATSTSMDSRIYSSQYTTRRQHLVVVSSVTPGKAVIK
jgi:hypothetical protein